MITMSIGAVLGALVVLGLVFRRLHLWHTPQVFLAGVFLAGSAVGHFARSAGEGGAQVVQQGVTAFNNGATAPPAAPARRVRKP